MDKKNYKKVSIIIPFYNVEKFIDKNVKSLLKQSYPNCEYIFVDDCSPDNSIDVIKKNLEEFPQRLNQVKIIRHEVNCGLPASRNTGMREASGDYIYHCDSDDWLEFDSIELMILHAEKYSADIVYSDYYLSFQKNERYMGQPKISNAMQAVESMLSGNMKYNVWNKLVRRELYQIYNISYPDGKGMGEDMTMIKLFSVAKNIAYLPTATYHYVQSNTNAFTKKFTESHERALYLNTMETISFLQSWYGSELKPELIHFFKLNVKLPFLISTEKRMYDLWRSWFSESNIYINKNPIFSKRIKILQYAALHKLDWYVSVYNRIIVKFIYGIIYR